MNSFFAPAKRDRSRSRKRYSLFGRSPALVEAEIEPVPQVTPDLRESAFPVSTFESDDEDDKVRPSSRKRSSRYFRQGSEALARWTARPSTASSAREFATQEERKLILKHRLKHGTDVVVSNQPRKISISSPYNFQHVAHTDNGQLLDMHSADRREPTSRPGTSETDIRIGRADQVPSLPPSRGSSRAVSPAGFKFTNSPLFGRAPRPHIQSSVTSPEFSPRTNFIPRSSSLADLASERRNAPVSVHPALRAPLEPVPIQAPLGLGLDLGTFQPAEVNRLLDAVPEELENSSAPNSPVKATIPKTGQNSLVQMVRDDSAESNGNGVREISSGSDWQNSVPSLWSGESSQWEDDIDYCYNLGLEAETDVESDWNSFRSSGPRDSMLPPPRKTFAEDTVDISPRVSLANHHHKKSSMVLNEFFTIVKVGGEWTPAGVFENPRSVPDTPQMEAVQLSPDFELPQVLPEAPVKAPAAEETTKRHSDIFSTPVKINERGHFRARSEPRQSTRSRSHSPIARPSARWTFIPPSQLSTSTSAPSPRPMSLYPRPASSYTRPASTYGASLHPPPSCPLPPVPSPQQQHDQAQKAKRVTVNFSHKRNTLSFEKYATVPSYRRPETDDRSLLQLAGRVVQGQRMSTTRPLRGSISSPFIGGDDVFGPESQVGFPAWI